MPLGRPSTLLDGLDDETKARIIEVLKSNKRERPTAIYRHFGLADRGIKCDSFVKWCRNERRKFKAQVDGGDGRIAADVSASAVKPRAFDTLTRTLALMNERLDAGDTKSLPGISMATRALLACMQVSLDEEANKRAAELHKIKIDQLTKDLRKGIDEKSENGAKKVTRAEIYDLIDQAMRGQL